MVSEQLLRFCGCPQFWNWRDLLSPACKPLTVRVPSQRGIFNYLSQQCLHFIFLFTGQFPAGDDSLWGHYEQRVENLQRMSLTTSSARVHILTLVSIDVPSFSQSAFSSFQKHIHRHTHTHTEKLSGIHRENTAATTVERSHAMSDRNCIFVPTQ